jgi:hypothetical protein
MNLSKIEEIREVITFILLNFLGLFKHLSCDVSHNKIYLQ